jgi:hypothetical protein
MTSANLVLGGDSMNPDALERVDAAKVTREWFNNRFNTQWNQFRWLMEQLAASCIAECLKNGEDEFQLCKRLDIAYDIIWTVWRAGAPEIATRWWKEGEKPSQAEQKIIDKAKATVWKRHDPKRSFAEGYESEHHTGFDQQDFYATVAAYLQHPELRHSVLDWIMVDMMVSRELSAFGEALKERFLPGPRDWAHFGIVHARYYKTKGNYLKMKTPDWAGLATKVVWTIAAPIAAIYSAFHFGYEGLGASLLSLYAVVVAGWLGLKVLRLVVKIGYALAGKSHPLAKPFVLWDQMYEVWKLLEGRSYTQCWFAK